MSTKTRKPVYTLVLAALFMAIGLLLPFLTGQLQQLGSALLPMHIPVLLCGLICGWQYGLAVGFILPLLRNLLFGMPPLFPIGVSMAFELATYGLLAGFIFNLFKKQDLKAVVISLVTAMIGGRIVWGIVRVLLVGIAGGDAFTWQMFLSGALLTAIPGIVLQLVLIPILMVALDRAGAIHFKK